MAYRKRTPRPITFFHYLFVGSVTGVTAATDLQYRV
jgi:hypothetical protein